MMAGASGLSGGMAPLPPRTHGIPPPRAHGARSKMFDCTTEYEAIERAMTELRGKEKGLRDEADFWEAMRQRRMTSAKI